MSAKSQEVTHTHTHSSVGTPLKGTDERCKPLEQLTVLSKLPEFLCSKTAAKLCAAGYQPICQERLEFVSSATSTSKLRWSPKGRAGPGTAATTEPHRGPRPLFQMLAATSKHR